MLEQYFFAPGPHQMTENSCRQSSMQQQWMASIFNGLLYKETTHIRGEEMQDVIFCTLDTVYGKLTEQHVLH